MAFSRDVMSPCRSASATNSDAWNSLMVPVELAVTRLLEAPAMHTIELLWALRVNFLGLY